MKYNWMLLLLFLVCVTVFMLFWWRFFSRLAKKYKIEHKHILALEAKVRDTFGVELATIRLNVEAQNQIVRIVNDLAGYAAKACTEQDKAHRSESKETPYSCFKDIDYMIEFTPDDSWDKAVHVFKTAWSDARKLANQILPELLERMPRFQEFEPLKDYNLHRPERHRVERPQILKWPSDKK